ncbi:putative reverse transcriptase domain-containing protein, partial [Tanacetum coccineum]
QKYEWGVEQEEAFQTLKDNLCNAPIYLLPDIFEDFVVYCDKSNQGLGCVLMQRGKSSVKDKILAAPDEASKVENATAEMLRGLEQLMEIKEDGVDRLTKSAHFLAIREDYKMENLARLYTDEIVPGHGVPMLIISYRNGRFNSSCVDDSGCCCVLVVVSCGLMRSRLGVGKYVTSEKEASSRRSIRELGLSVGTAIAKSVGGFFGRVCLGARWCLSEASVLGEIWWLLGDLEAHGGKVVEVSGVRRGDLGSGAVGSGGGKDGKWEGDPGWGVEDDSGPRDSTGVGEWGDGGGERAARGEDRVREDVGVVGEESGRVVSGSVWVVGLDVEFCFVMEMDYEVVLVIFVLRSVVVVVVVNSVTIEFNWLSRFILDVEIVNLEQNC